MLDITVQKLLSQSSKLTVLQGLTAQQALLLLSTVQEDNIKMLQTKYLANLAMLATIVRREVQLRLSVLLASIAQLSVNFQHPAQPQ
jgi:hypothetical protein